MHSLSNQGKVQDLAPNPKEDTQDPPTCPSRQKSLGLQTTLKDAEGDTVTSVNEWALTYDLFRDGIFCQHQHDDDQ